jgi:hypothetical protein
MSTDLARYDHRVRILHLRDYQEHHEQHRKDDQAIKYCPSRQT